MLFTGNAAEALFGGKNLSSTSKGSRIGEQLNHPWADIPGESQARPLQARKKGIFLTKRIVFV